MSHERPDVAAKPATTQSLIGWVALYTLVRIGLIVLVGAIIVGVGLLVGVKVPLFIAALFAVLIALPIGMIGFKGIRDKVNAQISAIDADRAARRSDLNARLRGDGH